MVLPSRQPPLSLCRSLASAHSSSPAVRKAGGRQNIVEDESSLMLFRVGTRRCRTASDIAVTAIPMVLESSGSTLEQRLDRSHSLSPFCIDSLYFCLSPFPFLCRCDPALSFSLASCRERSQPQPCTASFLDLSMISFMILFTPRCSAFACLVPTYGDLRGISTATPKSGAITATIAPSPWHGLSCSAVRLANIQVNLQLPMWDLQESWTRAARLQR